MKIRKVESFALRASPRSVWTFVEVTADDGRVGTGETTVHRDADRMDGLVRRVAAGLSETADPVAFLNDITETDDLVDASARSGLSQAITDLAAQRAGRPIWALHTTTPQKDIPVYANINRRTLDRTPEGFAKSASDAAAQGLTAFKIAPFDGVTTAMTLADASALLDVAFARIFAVRDAIGGGRLMVDCHWRLNRETFLAVLDVAAKAGLFWIECPYPEEAGWIEAIRDARRKANARGIHLAGLELKLWEPGFKPFLDGECYDVLMPDIKHVGSYERFYQLAAASRNTGVKIAPHNPTGPISHAHSVMACAAIENFLILEMQFDETEAFRRIVDGSLPMPAGGICARVDEPGLGLRLNTAELAKAGAP